MKAKAKLAKKKLRIAEQKRIKVRALSPMPPPSTSSYPEKIHDITALREIRSLVIKDVSKTEPTDEVRFVSSVYRPQDKQTIVRAPLRPLTTPRHGKTMSWTAQDSTSTCSQPSTLASEVTHLKTPIRDQEEGDREEGAFEEDEIDVSPFSVKATA